MRNHVLLALAALTVSAPAGAQDIVMRRPLPGGSTTTAPLPQAAQSSSVRSNGAQVAAAAMAFLRATGRLPGSASDLVPTYLPTFPSTQYASLQSWAFYSVGSRGLYQLSVPTEDECKAINRDAANGYGYAVIPGGQERGVNEGCYQNGGLGYIYVKWYNN